MNAKPPAGGRLTVQARKEAQAKVDGKKRELSGPWATILAAVLGAVVGALIGGFFSWILKPPPPEPQGKITDPTNQATVKDTFTVTGTVSDVPKKRHATLAVQSQDNHIVSLDVDPISSNERSWRRDVTVRHPAGQPFSLVLRLDTPDKTAYTQLDIINDLRVALPPCTKPPLQCLVSPLELANGADSYSFNGGGGKLTAAIGDDADCRRPIKAVGLRVNWTMPANSGGYGGWGVQWKDSLARHVDLSTYTKMVLSIRGNTGGETFQIAMLDTDFKEATIESKRFRPVSSSEWQDISFPLELFKGVNRASVSRLSLGWNDTHGAGGICIDEIAFR